MDYRIIKLNTCSNADQSMGALSFVEQEMEIPFEIKRLYHIYGVQKGKLRGFHAHKLNKQMLFCPYGKISITLDDGETREEVILDEPSKALLINSATWREMLWLQDDSVLCVAASEHYSAEEYIRDYNEFLSFVKANRASAESENG